MAVSAAKGSCLSPESHSRCQQLDKNQSRCSQHSHKRQTKRRRKKKKKKKKAELVISYHIPGHFPLAQAQNGWREIYLVGENPLQYSHIILHKKTGYQKGGTTTITVT